MHACFYDRRRSVLVNHERVEMDRNREIFTAMQFQQFWESGRHRLPTAVWVTWTDQGPDDRLSVWALDHSEMSPEEHDRVQELARAVHGRASA
jgi:hypothetical protein